MATVRADVLVAHQPAYLPWGGYFSRLVDVGRLVLLDHVQFTERGYQNRNYIRGPHGQRLRLTVPVRRRFGQPINEVRIADPRWAQRHWRSLVHAYARAPFWSNYADDLEAIYRRPFTCLVDVAETLTRFLLDSFGLDVELVRSSVVAPQGAKTHMLIDLARRTGTTVLRVGGGADAYLDTDLLAAAGIDLEVATFTDPSGGPPLSALDLLMHHGPGARQLLEHAGRIAPLRRSRLSPRARSNIGGGPAWVSVEGVNGVGKTHVIAEAARRLGDSCVVIAELPDTDPDQLPGQVIAALQAAGDAFLRTGYPRTETLALLALAVRRFEQARSSMPSGTELVLEDRGVDTVAVYQAAILAPSDDGQARDLVRQILASAARWRPPPDTTVLLVDDPDACRWRFERRSGRPPNDDERLLMERAGQLYGWLVQEEPERFVVIDRRGRSEDETVDALVAACSSTLDQTSATGGDTTAGVEEVE